MREKEFKTWITRKLNEIQPKMENQHKYTKVIKKIKDEINIFKRNKSEILELKNSLKSFNIQLKALSINWTKQKNITVWRQSFELSQSEKKKILFKNEQSLWKIWDYATWPNLCIIGVSERERRKVNNMKNIYGNNSRRILLILPERYKFREKKSREHLLDTIENEYHQGIQSPDSPRWMLKKKILKEAGE